MPGTLRFVGITTTLLLRVGGGALENVVEAVTKVEATGYVAVIAGDHDLMVAVFCRDVSHLNRVMREEIRPIPGVESVTSYLVTEVRYDSSANLVDLLEDEQSDDADVHSTSGIRRQRSA